MRFEFEPQIGDTKKNINTIRLSFEPIQSEIFLFFFF